MKKVFAKIEGAPEAIGPYSVAVSTGDLLFVSGQLSFDVKTGTIAGTTAAEQADVVMRNIQTILENLHSSLEHVVKTTIFLTDMDSFSEVNEVYGRYFKENCPARSCVEVSRLPKGALVEIETIALPGE